MAKNVLAEDHKDAWNVAHYRRANSNLARSYIEAIRCIRILYGKVACGVATMPPADRERIYALATACEDNPPPLPESEGHTQDTSK